MRRVPDGRSSRAHSRRVIRNQQARRVLHSMHSSPNAEIGAPMAWIQCLADRTRATHPSRLVMLSVIGLAIAAMQASAAVAAARKNAGGCGEYRYYRGGRCVDARGGDAGPPTHWHPNDPSNSRSGGV